MKRLAIITVALLVASPALATGNVYRRENLDPLVTHNPDVTVTSYRGNSGHHGSTAPNCAFAPKNIRACPDVTTGGSLSVPVSPTYIVKTAVEQPDTITPQYHEGELDKRDYLKAVAKELFNAIKEHRQPNPVPEGPFIEWDAAQTGSCD